MKRVKRVILGFSLLALVAAVPGVNAATVTYSGSFNGLTDLTNQLISVSQFDPSLGALLSVEFQLDATMTTSAFATNDGDFYVGWDKLQYEFSLVGDTGYSSVAISADDGDPVRVVGSGTPDGTFALFSEYAQITGQENWTYAGPTLTDSATFLEAALAAFIGTGDLNFFLTTLNLDALSVAGLQTGGQPNPAPFGLSTNILSNVMVTYDYTPVPIPAAVWLLGSGLAGLVGARRRRRK